jgi:hypothetical protein
MGALLPCVPMAPIPMRRLWRRATASLLEPIVCGSCQRVLPGDARYCPTCCGEDGRRGALQGAIFLGAVLGVLAGGLIAAVWSSAVGVEQTRWSDVLATLATCITMAWRSAFFAPFARAGRADDGAVCRESEEAAGGVAHRGDQSAGRCRRSAGVIENKAGSQGSVAVYNHLAQTYGAITPEAARKGLEMFAEHTEDARTPASMQY